MQYIVHANFVDGKPQLCVIEQGTGRVRLRWRMEKIQEMFENGEIKPEEFLQPDKYGMKLLVKNLFLIACGESLASRPGDARNDATYSTDKTTPAGDWRFTPRFGHMKSNQVKSRSSHEN